jgi:cation diffusion facilitator family transporter
MREGEKTALVSFLMNVVLFILKIIAAIASGSLAVLSSAFDSLNDIISYFLGYYSIKQAGRGPDYDHPFGHRRFQPLAGIVMAIFAGILAFEILREGTVNLLAGRHMVEITGFTFFVLLFTIVVKAVMYLVLRRKAKKTMSTALDAMAMDSRNDVLSNVVAVFGIAGAYLGELLFDDVAAILIAFYIAYSGYEVAKKNFDYVTGAKPGKKVMDAIAEKARLPMVKRLGKVRAHYVGDRVHVEVEIVVDKKLKGPESHDIEVKVQRSVESLRIVSRAFVHLDYD